MARIARRSLRIKGLPLFSLGHPWSSVVNAEGKLALSLFEPRFVEVASKLLPPRGDARFGYAESYPPRERTSGVLANIEDHRWVDEGHEEFVQGYGSGSQVQLLANAQHRFRILKARKEQQEGVDLYYANVQLMTERDLQRGLGLEAVAYWQEESSQGSDSRALSVKAGTHLVAIVTAAVFETAESWRVIGQVPEGIRVIAMDVPRVVEGYLMVPIIPSGAVELTLFREAAQPGSGEVPEVQLPDETVLKAALDGIHGRTLPAWRRLQRRKAPSPAPSRHARAEKKRRPVGARVRAGWGEQRCAALVQRCYHILDGSGVQQREETERNQSALITRVESGCLSRSASLDARSVEQPSMVWMGLGSAEPELGELDRWGRPRKRVIESDEDQEEKGHHDFGSKMPDD
ncbi:Hypothetical protein SCF082_LOCUS439 [Durusdinium trenchii]|uniref:Uncharacterized protein n=1 Tax=Durusdinium trenchii TaxID=1381693 RepID=A0ABP0H7J0_9DINO